MEQKFIDSHPGCVIVKSEKTEFKAEKYSGDTYTLYAIPPDSSLGNDPLEGVEIVKFPFTLHSLCEEDIVKYLKKTFPFRSIYKIRFNREIGPQRLCYKGEFTILMTYNRTGYLCTEPCPDLEVRFLTLLNGSDQGEVEVLSDCWTNIRRNTKLPEKEPITYGQAIMTFYEAFKKESNPQRKRIIQHKMKLYLKSFTKFMDTEIKPFFA